MMRIINIIVVIAAFTLLPTIFLGFVTIIYNGNFSHINPYEWERPARAFWTGMTIVMIIFGISGAIEGNKLRENNND